MFYFWVALAGTIIGVILYNVLNMIDRNNQAQLKTLLTHRDTIISVLSTLKSSKQENTSLFFQSSEKSKEEMIREYENSLEVIEQVILKKFKIYFTKL